MLNIENLIIEGSFFAPSGYSTVTRQFTSEYIDQYNEEHENIYLIDHHWDIDRAPINAEVEEKLQQHMYRGQKVEGRTMLLRWGSPHMFSKQEAKFDINAIYFVWELDRIPPTWVDHIEYYDVIFTVSKHSATAIKKVLKERGIDIPVYLIPHGRKEEYEPIPFDDNPMSSFTFRFLHVGTFIERKAVAEMIQSYCETFKEHDDVELYIKLTNIQNENHMRSIKRNIQKLLLNNGITNNPRIVFDWSIYNNREMQELYSSADFLLQVSHGEAWNMPILEGMACGTPSFALNVGGHTDYTNEESTMYVESGDLIPSQGQGYYDPINGLKWHSINWDDFKTRMRYIFDHYSEIELYAEEGLKIADKYRWNKIVKHANKLFNKVNNI